MPDFRYLEPEAHDGVQLSLLPIRVVGIDLGTTNSSAAEGTHDPGRDPSIDVECLAIEQAFGGDVDRHAIVPSVVAVTGAGAVVGEAARRLASRAAAHGLVDRETLFSECKNEIGLRKTYPRAPEGFRSPAEIGAHVLRFLMDGATQAGAAPERVVVTVPASFQAAQRADTVRAAQIAGIDLAPGDLLDEPVAAFVDLLVSRGGDPFARREGPCTLVVFDFGGGTCDVAVFEVEVHHTDRPAISPLAVSRYHRLGGGDIDRAIVYDVLLPQLVRQNGLGRFDLTFDDKKNRVEPMLLGVAEALKIAICSDPRAEAVVADAVSEIDFDGRTLRLERPAMSKSEFERLLDPFVDRDLLYARDTEYRHTLSIFAPLEDALDRAELFREEVDFCLMVGGSSLIPRVVAAIGEFLPNADIITYPDADAIQTAVARGAAYHALSLALFGKGVVKAVAHDAIYLRTEGGLFEIVPKGAELPFPSDARFATYDALAVPESTADGPVEIRVEVVAGEDERLLESCVWRVGVPVERGEPLDVEVCLDENQVLTVELRLARETEDLPFLCTIENPITHVVNPNATRVRIEQVEEDLNAGKVPAAQVSEKYLDLADDYVDLGQRDRALDCLHKALKKRGQPSAWILNRMGIICGQIGDHARQEKLYREAASLDPLWGMPLFNLALAQQRRGLADAARATIDEALERERRGPFLVLLAEIADAQRDAAGRETALAEALAAFGPVARLDDWELGWCLAAAKMARDDRLVREAESERQTRNANRSAASAGAGHLPLRRAGTPA